jgi:AraC family transcriptional regulator, arabinose operon regulatory protein
MQASRQSRKANAERIRDLSALRSECREPRLCAAIDFLLAHDLKRKFRTEDLSRHLNLSTSRLLHLFHEHFRCSPAQALKAQRLYKARELLAGFMTVKEIRFAVGLHDPSHFMRDFRRMFGEGPSELRKRLREIQARKGGHRLKVA